MPLSAMGRVKAKDVSPKGEQSGRKALPRFVAG